MSDALIVVQTAPLDVTGALTRLQANPKAGAVATFMGLMRDHNDGEQISQMTLEHYPGMTEAALRAISEEAGVRWPLYDVVILHRVGPLRPTDVIVFVGTTSTHRQAALDACAFIMDYLKTRAPFWKKETGAGGEHWVDARDSDDTAAQRWQAPGGEHGA